MKNKEHSKHPMSCANKSIKVAGNKDEKANQYAYKQRLY